MFLLGQAFHDVSNYAFLAYLDPGTGSYIFQFIIAGLLGLVFGVKTFWRKSVTMISSLFTKGQEDAKNDG